MGYQPWHMACASCYLGALEKRLNSILEAEQLCVSFPSFCLELFIINVFPAEKVAYVLLCNTWETSSHILQAK